MHFNYQSSIIILVRKFPNSIQIVAAVKATMVATLPLTEVVKMIETFYEQIRVFGILMSQDKEHEINTYIYNDTQIDVYLKQGKPITIIVSK